MFKCLSCGSEFDVIKLMDHGGQLIGIIAETPYPTLYCFNEDLFYLPLWFLQAEWPGGNTSCDICESFVDKRTKYGKLLKTKVLLAFGNRRNIRDLV